MADKVTISPDQFKDGLRRMMEASGKWNKGTTWIGDEPPTESQYTMWVDTSGEDDKLRFKDTSGAWKEISGSGPGGGLGGVGVAITPISVDSQTVSPGDECNISFLWETLSSESAKGTITLYVNSVQKYSEVWEQGEVSIPVQDYLTSGKTNEIKVVVKDIYGAENSYDKFSVSVISITLSSTFKQNTRMRKEDYPEFFSMPVTVKGGLDKFVHVVLDGVEIEDSSIEIKAEDAGTQQYVRIPSCSHGSHTLVMYATASLNGKTIESNKVFYDLLWTEDGNYDIIIVSSFNKKVANQYEILEIPYYVYNPAYSTSEVFYEVNGELLSDTPNIVSPREEIWETSGSRVGKNEFVIRAGDTEKKISIDLNEVETVSVNPVTTAMPLCLIASKTKSNSNELDRDIWESTGEVEGIRANFQNFNWQTNGWTVFKNKGALRISDGASLEIPYNIFEGKVINSANTNPKISGCTIEVDLFFDEVTNTDIPFLSCMSNGRGIEITPNQATLYSSGMSMKTLFTDGENKGSSMRFSFVITPSDPGIAYIYINGIGAAANKYSTSDGFIHEKDPAGITINSEGCSVTLHSVRVYYTALNQQQIIRNWIYDMANVSDQINAHTRNDIYDTANTGNNILYSKVLERIPCMTITGSMPTSKGDKKIVDIKFEGTEDGLLDFTLTEAQIDIQGTSSQYYPIKNWKFKSSYKIEDAMGNVLSKPKRKFEMKSGGVDKYPLADDQIPATVFCLKADYMESSSTHNTVTANIANGMYNEKTPPQIKDTTGRTRTTIYGRPIIVFYRETENSELTFGGKYNFNYDKDAEDVFGFVEDNDYEVVECVEFCNNTSERCLLQTSEYTSKITAPAGYDGDDMDANGEIPAYLQDFEFRYQWRREKDNNIKYDYLKAATDWVVSTDRSKATGKPLATPYKTNLGIAIYLYDLNMNIIKFKDDKGRERRAIDIGLGDIEYAYESYEVDELDIEGNPVLGDDGNPKKITYYTLPIDEEVWEKEKVVLEVYSFTHDTETYRLTKFKNELPEHFNVHYTLMYFNFMDLLGMIDSSTKNCFWATWGERHEKHADPTKDKVVIWYPIFYDMDTMLGLSNMGKMDIPYNAEFDSEMPVWDEESNSMSTSYVFNGHANVFWNNVKDAFVQELRTTFREKVSDGTLAQMRILNAYEDHSENFSEVMYNEDGNIKVISPYVDGYFGYSEESPDEMVMQHPDFVYIYQGDRFYHRRYWFPNRFNYVCSKNMAGSYVADYITMRLNTPTGDLAVEPNSNFTVVTYTDQYTRVKYGSKTVFSRCTHNEPTEIEAPPDTFNDTETIIYGASRIMSIGSLADKYARSIDLSRAKRLTVADIGSNAEGYTNDNLDVITFGSNPMLERVYLQNCPRLRDTLDLSGCPRIKTIEANGTNISLLSVPSPGVLERVILPKSMKSLRFMNHSNLSDFQLASVKTGDGENDYEYNLEDMIIEGTPIDTYDLVEHSPKLTRIRLTGINWNLADDTLLHYIKNNLKGYDGDGEDQDEPVLFGECTVFNIKDYLKDQLDSYFNHGVPVDKLPEFSQRDFRLTAKNVVTTYLVQFFDSVNATPLYSGIPDDRIVINNKAYYQGVTPVKPEDKFKTYEFKCWGVYEDGVLKPVEDITTYPISGDIDFYAIYEETEKIFTINFHYLNKETGFYDSSKTVNITYDDIILTEILPDDAIVNDAYAYRFKGWGLDNSTNVDILPGSSITINEDSDYVQDYYSIYNLDYKYRIKFVDEDGSAILDTAIYYTGDSVAVPPNPTKASDVPHDYTFDHWVFGTEKYGGEYGEIPSARGSIYEITYKAVYKASLRPYTVTFKNWNDTVLEEKTVLYSETPEYTGPHPEQPGDAQYTHTFTKWVPDIIPVDGITLEYKAEYETTINEYDVVWKNWDGEVLETDSTEYGQYPSYDSVTPIKPKDPQYTYDFIGWSTDGETVLDWIPTVRGAIEYIAVYKPVDRFYTVYWKDYDGSTLKIDKNVPYGDMSVYEGIPERGSTIDKVFTFSKWNTTVDTDEGEIVHTAGYTSETRKYPITWVFFDNEITEEWEYNLDILPTPPEGYRKGDKSTINGVEYEMEGYSPSIAPVTWSQTYTATVFKTETVVANPTKMGARYVYHTTNLPSVEPFLAGTGEYSTNVSQSVGNESYTHFYGFNFEFLRNLQSLTIEEILVSIQGAKLYSYFSNSKYPKFCFTTDFNTSGTDYTKYTALSPSLYIPTNKKPSSSSADHIGKDSVFHTSDFANSELNLKSWMNSNREKVFDGYNSNTFGLYLHSPEDNIGIGSIALQLTCKHLVSATFTPREPTYNVIWCNDDGSIIEIDDDMAVGAIPSYNGETPTQSDDDYVYTFLKWDGDITAPVTKDTIFRAVYKKQKRCKVTYICNGEQVNQVEVLEGNIAPAYTPPTTSWTINSKKTVKFVEWDRDMTQPITDHVTVISKLQATEIGTIAGHDDSSGPDDKNLAYDGDPNTWMTHTTTTNFLGNHSERAGFDVVVSEEVPENTILDSVYAKFTSKTNGSGKYKAENEAQLYYSYLRSDGTGWTFNTADITRTFTKSENSTVVFFNVEGYFDSTAIQRINSMNDIRKYLSPTVQRVNDTDYIAIRSCGYNVFVAEIEVVFKYSYIK